MPELAASAGTIEYGDTGGPGEVLVFVHGLMMDGTIWDDVVADLAWDHRCITPTLPLGAHRPAMRADADLSFAGIAALLSEFIRSLELTRLTLVVSDWGGPFASISEHPDRIAKVVILPCEAFDNIPPGLPGRMAAATGRLPGGIAVAARLLRIRPLRQLPLLFGWMAKKPLPQKLFERWTKPCCEDPGVRRDLRKYMADPGAGKTLQAATERLSAFERPALVLWATEDRVMPRAHGARLAALFKRARFVEIQDSFTLVQRDQPTLVAKFIREFTSAPA